LEYPEDANEVLTRLLTDEVPDPMKVNALEYPDEATEVLTKLEMDDVPDPIKV
jgi:hypothetical protein